MTEPGMCEGTILVKDRGRLPCDWPGRYVVDHPFLKRPLRLCGTHLRSLRGTMDFEVHDTKPELFADATRLGIPAVSAKDLVRTYEEDLEHGREYDPDPPEAA